MRQLLLYKWERDAPDAGPAHCSLPYIRLCGASSVIYGFRSHICDSLKGQHLVQRTLAPSMKRASY
jgi:hypothetical protein